ncbi:MAG: ATP-binding cassette domain-containing protein [Epsilonproteobacteria bacterium]|nr:ATP-binding cassette domain-containing protein [Campylobacterota bacterium]
MIDIHITKPLNTFMLDIAFSSNAKVIAVVGKSGSGKTTLIRCIAGFEQCDGYININNQNWIHMPIQQRNFGIVFQNYALFPNMTVLQNLKFASDDISKIHELLELMEITHIQDKYPSNISGGEKQRVALARALLNNPSILLLDEAFSALNHELKQKLYNEINLIKQHFDTQIILISHDIGEVYQLADEVIEISYGKVMRHFTLDELPIAQIIAQDKNTLTIKCNGQLYKVVT